jgi:hypothetical protein
MGASLVIPLTVYTLAFLIGGLAALLLPVETGQRPLQDTLKPFNFGK